MADQTVSELKILIRANAREARSEMAKVQMDLDALRKTVNQTSAPMKATSKATEGMKASIGGIASAAGLGSIGLALLARSIIQVGTASAKMAMDAQESENLFTVAFGSMSMAARVWSNSLSDSLGLNRYEVRKTAGTFNLMLNAMEMGKKQAFEMSTRLTELAFDMQSLYNLADGEALGIIRSLMSGEAEPGKRFGILINETTVKQYALRKGIASTTRELTEQEKVMARYQLLLEQTEAAQGDLARTADSPTNMLRRLNNLWTETRIEIGNALIPALEAMIPVLIEAANWAKEMAGHLAYAAGIIKGLFGTVSDASDLTVAALEKEKLLDKEARLKSGIKASTKQQEDFNKAVRAGLAGFDEINSIPIKSQGKEAATSFETGGGGSIDFAIPQTETFSEIRKTIDDIAKIAAKFKWLIEAIGWAAEKLSGFSKMMREGFGILNIGSLIWVFNKQWEIIREKFPEAYVWLEQAGKDISAWLSQAWTDASAWVSQAWADYVGWIDGAVKNTKKWLSKAWSDYSGFMKGLSDDFKKWLAGLPDKIAETWPKVKAFFSNAWQGIKDVFVNVRTWFSDRFTSAVDGIKLAWSGLKGFFSSLWAGIKQGASSVFTGIVDVLKAPINAIIRTLNWAIGELNRFKVTLPTIGILGDLSGKTIGFDIPKLKELALGTVVDRPTPAIFGEAGREAALPLTNQSIMSSLGEEIARYITAAEGGSSGSMQLVVKIGEETILTRLVDGLNRQTRMTGFGQVVV